MEISVRCMLCFFCARGTPLNLLASVGKQSYLFIPFVAKMQCSKLQTVISPFGPYRLPQLG